MENTLQYTSPHLIFLHQTRVVFLKQFKIISTVSLLDIFDRLKKQITAKVLFTK